MEAVHPSLRRTATQGFAGLDLGIFSLTMRLLHVLVSFMSAAAQLPAPTTDPDPPRANAAMPSRPRPRAQPRPQTDRLRQATRRHGPPARHRPGFALFARPFGTADLAVILARIANGLRRAMALEARLSNAPPAARTSRRRPSASPPSAGRAPHGRSRRGTPNLNPSPHHTEDPRLAHLPTARKSPPRCVCARSAPSSPISAVISESRPASSTGPSGTNSATPSSRMAEASPASSAT